MNKNILKLCEELAGVIEKSYEEAVTIPEAEKLAARFLHGQMLVATELAVSDLDARMKKSGTKRIRAAVYLEEVGNHDKKPSDSFLEAKVNVSELVEMEQKSLDQAEADRDLLQNYLSVLREGHIFFRGIAKGRFE